MFIQQLLLFMLTSVLACDNDFGDVAKSQLVVEGWIDSGRFPVVMLSRTMPVGGEFTPMGSIKDYVERWAKVTVSDGEREVILVGRPDNGYFPPFIYTSTDMRGVEGRTYKLSVDCPDGTHAEAVTSISKPVVIDSFAIEPVAVADSLRQIYAFIGDARAENDYYKVFTHVLGRPYGYLSSYLGIAAGSSLAADGRLPVNPGRINITPDFSTYFAVGDTVMVKIARIDSVAYAFWRDFEDMTTLSGNPFFPVTNNIQSNVSGALGYWFGYGSTYKSLIVKP